MEIIQIAGYKNSGKTTFAVQLIHTLSQQGFSVASLKHHGHGGLPLGFENTDSEKHQNAGAVVAGVEGDGVLQLSRNKAWSLADMTAVYKMLGTEVLVVEGFKQASYPKIVTIGKEEDVSLLHELTNIRAVLTAVPLKEEEIAYPIYHRSEAGSLCKQIVKQVKIDD